MDQPKPNGTGRAIAPLVAQDLTERVRKGMETYGQPLRAFNGREALWDLYEELLDAVMYIRQAIEERDAILDKITDVPPALLKTGEDPLLESRPNARELLEHGTTAREFLGKLEQSVDIRTAPYGACGPGRCLVPETCSSSKLCAFPSPTFTLKPGRIIPVDGPGAPCGDPVGYDSEGRYLDPYSVDSTEVQRFSAYETWREANKDKFTIFTSEPTPTTNTVGADIDVPEVSFDGYKPSDVPTVDDPTSNHEVEFPPNMTPKTKQLTIYLSGPMTGLPDFNKPAFDAYAEKFRAKGFRVLSPPELDGGDTTQPYDFYIRRDVRVLIEEGVDRIYMMPGWHKSKGAQLEKHVAELCGIGIYDAETEQPWEETLLQEAQRLVHGDRGDNYGHPIEDFGRTAGMLTHLLSDKLRKDVTLTARDVWMIMVCVKLSRERNRPKRDNRVDIAGYAETGQMVEDEAQRRRIDLS